MVAKMAKDLENLHRAALKRFERLENNEKDQRELAVEDIRFAQVEDGQWDEEAKGNRKGRPLFTINRVAGAIDQLIGDQRQSRTAIKLRPSGGDASEDTARTMEGLIRNIESTSKAQNSYDNAFDEMVNGGYGGWRVTTEYNDDDAFTQDIRIQSIMGATTSLWFDDAATEYDKRDANFAFLATDMPMEEREMRWPDRPIVDFERPEYKESSCASWRNNDTARVAEYWVKEPVTKQLALLSNGQVIDQDEEASVLDELAESGVTVVKSRSVESHKVVMYLIDGAGILEGPKEWAGKHIPLVPVFGRQSFVEGRNYVRGLVRFAKDANRIYNYTTSATVEASALSPKDPYFATPKQIEGHKAQWTTFNTKNPPVMLYNADPATGGAPPQRGGAPSVQQALIQQTQQASMDLYHVTGMQPPSIGVNPELKSGKAIQAQERQGDRGSYIFTDNLEKSKEYTAEILVDLIPRIYDTAKQVRIMNQDGTTDFVEINTTVQDRQTGEQVLVNDLSAGKYDVVAETGPAFATQRQEAAQQLIDLATGSDVFAQMTPDLIAKDLQLLQGDELHKRMRKFMIGQGIATPTEEEVEELGLNQEQAPDPQQQAITENIQIQTEKLISEIEEKDAKTMQIKLDTQQATIETYEKLVSALVAKQEAGIPLSPSDRDAMVKQLDIIGEGQQMVDEGPNSEQAADLVAMQAAQQTAMQADNMEGMQQGEQIDGAPRLTVEQPTV